MKEEHYSDSDIQVLEGLEAVRKRPGMYIGTTGEKGLHHLVWEIIDNAVDEALAGYCDDIEVIVDKENVIEIRDDGRGMPTGINKKTGLSTITSISSQYPAKASSTALSTISQTRWCNPFSPVVPIYIPGLLRTASSPSNTWISLSE